MANDNLQPKAISEYTPITNPDGNEVLIFAKGGVNGTVRTGDLPLKAGVQAQIDAKANTSSLATVATSGDYNDLANKPIISNAVTSVAGKTGAVTLVKGDVGLGNVDNTADTAKPVSSATQTALNAKANTSSLAPVATSGVYADLTGKPTIPTQYTDAQAAAAAPVQSVSGRTGAVTLTKSDVGLTNVDNTSDVSKPVSTATATALAAKAATTYVDSQDALNEKLANKNAVNGYAGLGSDGKVAAAQLPSYVDDVLDFANFASLPATGEAGKIYITDDTNFEYRWNTGSSAYIRIVASPGSTDALAEGTTNLYFTNARAAAAAPVQSVAGRTGVVTLTSTDVGLGNVTNTSDANKPVSTAQAAAIALKANTASPTFTGQVTMPTGSATAPGMVIPAGPVSSTPIYGAIEFDGTDLTYVNNTGSLNRIKVVGTTRTQQLSNKTLDNTNNVYLLDTLFTLQDDGDPTKQAKFELSGITASTTRTFALPNANVTLIGRDDAATVTNKSMSGTANTFSAIPESAVTNLVSDLASKLTNITSLISAGSNITITGAGTAASPYVITSTAAGGGGGTVTNVTSTTTDLTVATGTTTPALTVNSAPKLTTARNINGVAFDGTANITVADATKEPVIATGTTSQYIRGDKSLATLNSDAAPEGSSNLYFTNARASAAAPVQSVAGLTGAPTAAQVKTALAIAESDVANLVSDLAAKAPLASPALTGTPTAPTATAGTNTTQLATTAFVVAADALDAHLAATQTFAGTNTFSVSPIIPTPTAGDNTTKAASTAFTTTAITNERTAVRTLTNARVTNRVASLTAASNVYTPTGDTIDLAIINAPVAAYTIANPTGTPTDGQVLTIRTITGATPFAITYGTIYAASQSVALPAILPASTTTNQVFIYNTNLTKWVLVGTDLPATYYQPLQIKAQRTVTAATTITSADGVIYMNSASAVTQALPTTGLTAPFMVKIVNIAAGVVTISNTVAGTASRTQAQNTSVDYLWDGVNWWLG